MKFIAHRGNTAGPQPTCENTHSYLMEALDAGHDVEGDVQAHNGVLYLGHDGPRQVANMDFLNLPEVWVHAKNIEAVSLLRDTGIHWFWHERDQITLTSQGIIWCYPGIYTHSSPEVWLDLEGVTLPPISDNLYGICGDVYRP